MISKKTLPVVGVLLLLAGAALAGAGALQSQQLPPGDVVPAKGIYTGDGSGQPAIPPSPPLPAATGAVALSDNFDGGKLDAWHALAGAEGRWAAREGRLQQWGNIDGDLTDSPAILASNDATFADGVFEAQVLPTSGEPAGVVFRGSNSGYYRLSLFPSIGSPTQPHVRLDRFSSDGTSATVAVDSSWGGYTLNSWVLVTVRAQGSHFTVSLDGKQVLDATDGSLVRGWVGVWSPADRGAQFDNVRVQRTSGQ